MNDSKTLQMVLGALFVAFLAFQGWLADSVSDMKNRLTKIETSIDQNREERQAQVNDLRDRISRLEAQVYQENGE